MAIADVSRDIDLEFVTTVNQYAPWEFQAELDGMSGIRKELNLVPGVARAL